MLVQLGFRLRLRKGVAPTRRMIEALGRRWLRKERLPAGVSITPRIWGSGQVDELRNEHVLFGCPGVVKYFARPDFVMCDYDNGPAPGIPAVHRVMDTLGLRVRAVEYAKTRRGWHMVIALREQLSPAETTALQAILGSDPARETFNLARVRSGKTSDQAWNILFEYKLK